MRLIATAALLAIAPALAFAAAPAAAQNEFMPMAPESAAKFNLDTPIEKIAADPAGKAVLDADLPGLTTHEMYDSFKGMSLRQLQPMSDGKLTDAAMKKTETDLAKL